MAFGDPCRGDLDKLSLFERLDIFCSDIAHSCPEPTDKLKDHFRQCALKWYPADYPFRNLFLDIIFHILEISVLRAFLHGLDRSHPAVILEFPSIVNDGIPG